LLPIAKGAPTVASILKKAGYATGGFGKWGIGNVGTEGVPEKHGFDLWYGYTDKSWSQMVKNYAAMVTLLDAAVGRIIAKCKELGIADNTLIIYTSDNGANGPFIKAIQSSGGLRGAKRSLYEGGIRAPMVAYWPGKVAAGSTTDLLTSQVDLMATAAEMAGVKAPANTDGISILPTLLGKDQKTKHDFLYFEIYEGAFPAMCPHGQLERLPQGNQRPSAGL